MSHNIYNTSRGESNSEFWRSEAQRSRVFATISKLSEGSGKVIAPIMASNKRVWVKCVNMHRDKFKVSVDDVDDVDDLKKAIAKETTKRHFPLGVSRIVNSDNLSMAYDVQTRIAEISPDLYSRTVLFTAGKFEQNLFMSC